MGMSARKYMHKKNQYVTGVYGYRKGGSKLLAIGGPGTVCINEDWSELVNVSK